MCQEKLQEFKDAMLNYKKCLTSESNHFGACYHLAKLLVQLGEHTRAIKYFKHAIKIDADSVPAQFGLAKAIHNSSEDKSGAVPHYEEVIRRDDSHFKALTQLGLLYLEYEEFDLSA